ncbi:hypothetical protein GEMRC1_008315 [Eukaryota sp. GEM-RC1]
MSGTLWITSHRLLYCPSCNSCKLSLSLKQIQSNSLDYKRGFLRRHPKVNFTSSSLPPRPGQPQLPPLPIWLSFQRAGATDCYSSLQAALSDQAWILPTSTVSDSAPRAAGIAGTKAMIEHEREVARSAVDGLEELNDLKTKAKELTVLANRLASSVKEVQNDSSSDQKTVEEAETRVTDVLDSLGFASVASKHNHTHEEFINRVAVEILQVLDPILKKKENSLGMIGLFDCFCLINRARGTELLSPNDFYLACTRLKSLNAGMHLHKFSSKSMAIMTGNSLTEVLTVIKTAIIAETDIYFKNVNVSDTITINNGHYRGFSAMELSTLLSISLGLVKDLVQAAEEKGFLIRDISTQGTLYWLNIF